MSDDLEIRRGDVLWICCDPSSMVVTYDRSRVVTRAGRVSTQAMKLLDAALAMHLGLARS